MFKKEGDMLSRHRAWDLINDLNERAHQQVYELWEEADKLEDETETEAEGIKSHDMKVEASNEQAKVFKELISYMSEDEIKSIWLYVRNDEDFRSQFESWYGELDNNYNRGFIKN